MLSSAITSVILFILTVTVQDAHKLDYSDLQALGVACSDHRDSCASYRYNLPYFDRNCECDAACNAYRDCCVDARTRNPNRRVNVRDNMVCLHCGDRDYEGVYVIATCNPYWRESRVRLGCQGPTNFSDPLYAAPVTSVAQRVTYRNRYCAECNYADMLNLKTFQFKLTCDMPSSMTEEEMYSDMVYNRPLDTWGYNRLNSFGNATEFIGCDMIFVVPNYINDSVRFCRSNLISSCPPEYTRTDVSTHCAEYMAVVYDRELAYRNVHCAMCNNRNVGQITCKTKTKTNPLAWKKRRPFSLGLLFDVNQHHGNQDGMTQVPSPVCPHKYIYDPFFKKCRQLVCAYPGHHVVNRKCVRNSVPLAKKRSPMSLDVNLNEGYQLAKIPSKTECQPNYIYDPYFKKCRKLVCALPNYHVVGRKCVKN